MSDLTGATLKMALVSSSYTPNAAYNGHSLYSDLTNELANGDGYTTGGASLASKAIASITGGWKFSSADVAWTASGSGIPAWRYGVLYVSGSLWSKSSPLIGYFVGDSTPADIALTSAGNTLTIYCPSGGWFDVS